ncbi:unnamed protein product [Brassica oleracea var. botrytis]
MEARDHDVIVIPHEIMQQIDEENQRSLVLKLLNPKIQKSRQILKMFSQACG